MLMDKYCMYLFCGLPSVRISKLRFIQVTVFINHQLAPGCVMFRGVSIWWLIHSPAEGHWTSYQFGRKPWLPLISINWMSVTWSHHSSEKKGPCMSSSWSPLKWGEDLVGCYHIVNSSELSFLDVFDYLHTSSFAWGRCGMVGTYVPSTTSEVRFEAAFENIGNHLVRKTGPAPFHSGGPQTFWPQAIPARYSRQFRIWKPLYTVFSQNLFYFYHVWKVNSDLIDNVNLLLICHQPARLWGRMFVTCTQNVSVT